MKHFPRFILAILFVGIAHISFSQNGLATIRKNRNITASGFYHDLNKTKDTLIIKSDKKINYLYTANNSKEKEVNVRVDSNSYKLPLNKLRKGRNVLVAIQSPLRIVFVVDVIKEYPKGSE